MLRFIPMQQLSNRRSLVLNRVQTMIAVVLAIAFVISGSPAHALSSICEAMFESVVLDKAQLQSATLRWTFMKISPSSAKTVAGWVSRQLISLKQAENLVERGDISVLDILKEKKQISETLHIQLADTFGQIRVGEAIGEPRTIGHKSPLAVDGYYQRQDFLGLKPDSKAIVLKAPATGQKVASIEYSVDAENTLHIHWIQVVKTHRGSDLVSTLFREVKLDNPEIESIEFYVSGRLQAKIKERVRGGTTEEDVLRMTSLYRAAAVAGFENIEISTGSKPVPKQ